MQMGIRSRLGRKEFAGCGYGRKRVGIRWNTTSCGFVESDHKRLSIALQTMCKKTEFSGQK